MQILIPDLCISNTYVNDLAFALEGLGHQVFWNSDNLFHSQWLPEVILSQWADGYLRTFQALKGIQNLQTHQLEILEKKLKQVKEKTLIIAFVHNVKPRHSGNQELDKKLKQLFEINYGSAHAFVHLGKQSIVELESYYLEHIYKNKPSLIISHGLNELLKMNYSSTKWHDNKTKQFRIFVPGAIRYWSELTFLITAFLKVKIPNKHLVIAGGGNALVGKHPVKPLRRALIKNLPGVSLFASRLDDETLCREITAADLIIAPRLWATNSGIPYLAATFGKRCLGPNVGNLPEALKELNGVLFDPNNSSSLTRAMEIAYNERDLFLLPDPPCPSWREIAKQIEDLIISFKAQK